MSLEKVQAMGILVEPAAAALIESGSAAAVQRLIAKLADMPDRPLSLNRATARRLLLPEARLLRRLEPAGQQSIGDLVAAWGERFSTLQRLLMRRPELAGAVSLGSAAGSCVVIGQVRASGARLELEDPTGAVELILPPSVVVLPDDVIGAIGRCEGGVLRVDSVVWPDAPLRAAVRGQGRVQIGGGPMADVDWRIEPAGTEWWQIGGAMLLVHKADWAGLAEKLQVRAEEVPAEMLKRRHLFRPPSDALEPLPDVFVALGIEAKGSYRGTRIVGTRGAVLIDLEAPP